MSGFQRTSGYQLEPITANKRLKNQLERRDRRLKESQMIDMRQYDTLNSSLMNYQEVDQPMDLKKRPIKRNMTAVRKHNNANAHSNQSIYNIGTIPS